MKKGDKRILDYYRGLHYKTQAPSSIIEISSKGVITIKSNPLDVVRVYVNILNSFDAVIKTIPIDVLPLNKESNTYVSIYVG